MSRQGPGVLGLWAHLGAPGLGGAGRLACDTCGHLLSCSTSSSEYGTRPYLPRCLPAQARGGSLTFCPPCNGEGQASGGGSRSRPPLGASTSWACGPRSPSLTGTRLPLGVGWWPSHPKVTVSTSVCGQPRPAVGTEAAASAAGSVAPGQAHGKYKLRAPVDPFVATSCAQGLQGTVAAIRSESSRLPVETSVLQRLCEWHWARLGPSSLGC